MTRSSRHLMTFRLRFLHGGLGGVKLTPYTQHLSAPCPARREPLNHRYRALDSKLSPSSHRIRKIPIRSSTADQMLTKK
jgi:hypothetical protein